MLRLSIIVNMYNTAKYMPRCIDSLICQDIPLSDYEILLVDDCSPDNSLEMANEYSSKYPNIRVFHHEQNKGLAGGRNTGVDAAEGEYMCFVDPDDYIEKNSLAALLQQMEDENLDMLRFNYQKVDEEYNFVPDSLDEAAFDYTSGVTTGTEFLAHRLGIACYVWAYIYRTEFVKQSGVRFIEGIYFDDTPWLPRILQQAKRINCVPTRHQFYLQRSGSLVHTPTPEAVLHKIHGQLALMDVLSQHKLIANPNVRDWYDRIIGHSVFSIINAAIILPKTERKQVISLLCSMHTFPIRIKPRKMSARIKLIMMSFSPQLYVDVMHIYRVVSSQLIP